MKEAELRRLASTGEWKTLACEYGFPWLLADTERPDSVLARPVMLPWRRKREQKAWLYEIGTLGR